MAYVYYQIIFNNFPFADKHYMPHLSNRNMNEGTAVSEHDIKGLRTRTVIIPCSINFRNRCRRVINFKSLPCHFSYLLNGKLSEPKVRAGKFYRELNHNSSLVKPVAVTIYTILSDSCMDTVTIRHLNHLNNEFVVIRLYRVSHLLPNSAFL